MSPLLHRNWFKSSWRPTEPDPRLLSRSLLPGFAPSWFRRTRTDGGFFGPELRSMRACGVRKVSPLLALHCGLYHTCTLFCKYLRSLLEALESG